MVTSIAVNEGRDAGLAQLARLQKSESMGASPPDHDGSLLVRQKGSVNLPVGFGGLRDIAFRTAGSRQARVPSGCRLIAGRFLEHRENRRCGGSVIHGHHPLVGIIKQQGMMMMHRFRVSVLVHRPCQEGFPGFCWTWVHLDCSVVIDICSFQGFDSILRSHDRTLAFRLLA